MLELNKDEYKAILPYITNLLQYNFIIYSVIDGSVDGRIFVDKKENIETVLLWDKTNCAGIYIEGKYSRIIADKMNQIIKNIIIPEGKSIEDTRDITVCFHPIEIWQDKLSEEVFQGIDIRNLERKFFYFDKTKHLTNKWNQKLPKSLELIKFDENSSVFTSKGLKNSDEIIDMVKYSKDKFGSYIIDKREKKIIAWCTSDWSSEKHVEFGIETKEEYQKQGYGSICAITSVEYALERGYEFIGWHCWGDNTASEKTALKAGYEYERTHPVVHCWYNTYDNMVVATNSYLYKKEFEKALKYFNEAERMRIGNTEDFQEAYLKSVDYQNWLLTRGAKCYAMVNEAEKSIILLKRILENGVKHPSDFLNDLKESQEYHRLKDHRKFKEIIAHVKKMI